jgi:hypothetical protein
VGGLTTRRHTTRLPACVRVRRLDTSSEYVLGQVVSPVLVASRERLETCAQLDRLDSTVPSDSALLSTARRAVTQHGPCYMPRWEIISSLVVQMARAAQG